MQANQMRDMVQGMTQMMMAIMPMSMMTGMMSPVFGKSSSEKRSWWVLWYKKGEGRSAAVLSGSFTSEPKATRFIEDNEEAADDYTYLLFSTKSDNFMSALEKGLKKASIE